MSLRDDETTIQNLLDGKLGEAEFSKVEQRMQADRDFRRLYLSYVKAHHLLLEKFETRGGTIFQLPASPIAVRRRRMWLACAASVALLAGAAAWLRATAPEPKAILVYGPESKGRTDHPEGRVGKHVMWVGSTLELDRGSVAIVMPSGVRGYFEGPGKLDMENPNKLRLHSGRAWFDVPEGADGFVCSTDSLFVEDLGTEFGVIADPGHPEEVFVIKGKVRLHPHNRPAEIRNLVQGQGTAWKDQRFEGATSPSAFSAAFPEKVVVFADDFHEADGTPLDGKEPDVGAGPWKTTRGAMEVRNGVLDTRGERRNAAFAPLGQPYLNDLTHILLLTIEAHGPGDEGWAGVSLYTGDQERIFVGDPCGSSGDWALHPAGLQAINACPLLEGISTVTLRYDYRTGLVELFEGEETTGTPRASQWIAPGLAFDRIRVANGSMMDAILDAGGNAAEVKPYDALNVRSNIAVRKIKATVLSAANSIRKIN